MSDRMLGCAAIGLWLATFALIIAGSQWAWVPANWAGIAQGMLHARH